MPNYLRPKVQAATIFFTVCLAERGGTLLLQHLPQLRFAVAKARQLRPFAIDAWVVLPDHMHAIWTLPQGDSDFSTRWKDIKSEFSKSVRPARPRSRSKVAKGEIGIWQRRFWEHHIRDEADLDVHMRYCWGNPVKHGLVQKPIDWPYSSFHRDIRLGKVDAQWSGQVGNGQFGE